MPKFPSVEWFDTMREMANSDEASRRLGTGDARVGVKVGDKLYELTFEAFECEAAREIEERELRDLDFWLEQSPDEWRDMIENIKKNGSADLNHPPNTICLTPPHGLPK